jgi:hypothetical protein
MRTSTEWQLARSAAEHYQTILTPAILGPFAEALAASIARHIGPETATGLQSAFALTDAVAIRALLTATGFGQTETAVTQLDLPFPDLVGFIPRHISATPMAAGYSRAEESIRQKVVNEVVAALEQYCENGRYQIPFCSHMIRGRK